MNTEDENLIPVEGHNNLFRDRFTGAIVNTDRSAYSNYIRMKEQKQKEKDELNQIKSDIEEIKSLLKELTNGSRQN
jgi:predicted transcriptional regulator